MTSGRSTFDLDGAVPLAPDFFSRDTRRVAEDLLGKVFASTAEDALVAGRIVETEAYLGRDDRGSHAATKGRTARNEAMYGRPGTVYVYFTYGMHHMLNLVCEPEGTAGAVLIRALEPVVGVEIMRERRGGRPLRQLTDGPGKVAQALAVDLTCNRTSLGDGPLVVYDAPVPSEAVGRSGRIGLSVGREHEYRYFVAGNPFVSRSRTGASSPQRRTDGGR